MGVAKRGKFLLGPGLVFGIGIALSACAGSGADYANGYGYYGYPDYNDYGYLDSFGFVGRDRDHDRRHDHDGGNDRGMLGGERGFVSRAPSGGTGFVSHGLGGEHGFAGGHGGGGSFAGGHGGGGGRR